MVSNLSRLIYPQRGFIILLFAFVALRVVALFATSESFIFEEELYRGAIGIEILEGLKLPLWDYRPDDYSAGPLLIGIFAAFFFKLFGPTYFVLKMVPLCYSVVTFLLVYFVMKALWNERAALFACVLWIALPATYVHLSLAAMGFHSESILWGLALLWLLHSYWNGETHRLLFLGLFSVLSGLSIWYTAINGITVFALLLAWCLRNRKSFFSGHFLVFVVFFSLGIMPLIIYNYFHDGATYAYLGKMFANPFVGDASSTSVILKALRFLLLSFPFSFGLPTQVVSIHALSGYLYFGLLLFPILLMWLSRKSDAFSTDAFFIIYPFLFFMIYLSSNYSIGASFRDVISYVSYRYLYPISGFFVLYSAIRMSQARLGIYILIPVLFLGLTSQAMAWMKPTTVPVLKIKGYSDHQLGEFFSERHFEDRQRLNDFLSLIEQFPEERRPFILRGYWRDAFNWDAYDTTDADYLLKTTPSKAKPFVFDTFASELGERSIVDYEQLEQVTSKLPKELLRSFFHGIAWRMFEDIDKGVQDAEVFYQAMSESFRDQLELYRGEKHATDSAPNVAIQDYLKKLSPDARAWYLRGVGSGIADTWLNMAELRRKLKMWRKFLPPNDHTFLAWGVGWKFRASTAEDRERTLARIRVLPKELQKDARGGIATYDYYYGLREGETHD